MKDSTYNYVHMPDQRHVLFRELWQRDDLGFDDIDLPPGAYSLSATTRENLLQQFLSSGDEVENDLTIINGSNPMFNSSYANRMKQKSRNLNWKDLGLSEFLSKERHVKDTSILQRPQFGADLGPAGTGEAGLNGVLDTDLQMETAAARDPVAAAGRIAVTVSAPDEPELSFLPEEINSTANFDEPDSFIGRVHRHDGQRRNNGTGGGAIGIADSTPVVSNRTISQSLESMSSLGAQVKRRHSVRQASAGSEGQGQGQDRSQGQASAGDSATASARMIR